MKQGEPDDGVLRETPTAYRTTQRLSATEAARNFSDLLNRVRYRGESFIVERGGVAVCELRPVAPPRFSGRDLLTVLRALPRADPGYFDAVEQVTRNQPALPDSPWEP